jgi:hypothetical protein
MMTRRRLILHIGMPKTASSALQRWCADHRDALGNFDVDYPPTGPFAHIPAHYYLSMGLVVGVINDLKHHLGKSHRRTVLLSDESLVVITDRISTAAQTTFHNITREFDTTIFMLTRERNAWLKSYYRELLAMPPAGFRSIHFGIPAGTDLRFEEFVRHPHVTHLLDTESCLAEAMACFGATRSVVVRYEDDWLAQLLDLLDIPDRTAFGQPASVNAGFTDDVAELIRLVNGLGLTEAERNSALSWLGSRVASGHVRLNVYTQLARPDRRVFETLEPVGPSQRKLLEVLLSDDPHQSVRP